MPMALETILDDPNPAVSRTKSILARFSSPITKRSKNTFDFDILLDHPLKEYRPGETVKGRINLNVYKGFDITHLVIALHGYAKVFKHQCAPGEGRPTPDELINGKGTRGFEYYGNGLVSLFQDEQTLCGSGFLRKQVYQFGFELQFPAHGLPSTIDFERGTIAYMVSATVTRPTAIAPTITKTVKVLFKDRIDIESMYTPKSRAISLEPIVRRGKVKRVKPAASTSTQETSIRGDLSRQDTQSSSQTRSNTTTSQRPPLSPAPSEDTVETNATGETQEYNTVDYDSSQRRGSPNNSETKSSLTSTSMQTITATTEIPRHGATAGDMLPIKIVVSHTKPTRGLVIATLYRSCRVDMHPILPLATRGKNSRQEYEDVYPRSRTGLGGLYFANGSPNSVFRKDLAQTSTMMIVNPATLTADIRLSIKIPNDAFPTVSNVPGGMISFTYHLEVVIDLTGKLRESRLLPSLTSGGSAFTATAPSGDSLTSDWGNNVLDTSPLRRTKSVATFEFPVTVGTEDSSRSKKQQKMVENSEYRHDANTYSQWQNENDFYHDANQQWHDYDPHWQGYYGGYDSYGNYFWYDEFGNSVYDDWQGAHPEENANANRGSVPIRLPPPQTEEIVDEKTRLRRQEELLLPSQPPDSGDSSSSATAPPASAPILDETTQPSSTPISPTSSRPITFSRASARSGDTVIPDPLTPPPSLPENEVQDATEDKQELERRRLMAQASAPPIDDVDDVTQGSSSQASTSRTAVPSAPVIDEEEEYNSQSLRQEGNETLPQYHR